MHYWDFIFLESNIIVCTLGKDEIKSLKWEIFIIWIGKCLSISDGRHFFNFGKVNKIFWHISRNVLLTSDTDLICFIFKYFKISNKISVGSSIFLKKKVIFNELLSIYLNISHKHSTMYRPRDETFHRNFRIVFPYF